MPPLKPLNLGVELVLRRPIETTPETGQVAPSTDSPLCRRKFQKFDVVTPAFSEPGSGTLGEKNRIVTGAPNQVATVPRIDVKFQVFV